MGKKPDWYGFQEINGRKRSRTGYKGNFLSRFLKMILVFLFIPVLFLAVPVLLLPSGFSSLRGAGATRIAAVPVASHCGGVYC